MSLPISEHFDRTRRWVYVPGMVLSVLVIGAAFGLFWLVGRQGDFTSQLTKDLRAREVAIITNALESSWTVASTDRTALKEHFQPLLQELAGTSEIIDEIGLVEANGRYFAHSFPSRIGRESPHADSLTSVLFQGTDALFWPESDSDRRFSALQRFSFHAYEKREGESPPFADRIAVSVVLRTEMLAEAQQQYQLSTYFVGGVFILVALLAGASTWGLIKYYEVNKALDSLESYVQILVDNLNSAVVFADIDNQIISLNEQAERFFGVKEADVKRQHLSALLPDPRNKELLGQLCEMYRIRQGDSTVWIDESPYPVGLRMREVKDHLDEVAGKTIIFEDERELLELRREIQRSEKLASLGRMAAMIAHEVRNPLNAVQGHAQVIAQALDDDESGITSDQHEAWMTSLTLMQDEVSRLNRFVSELLHFSAPQRVELEEIEINTVIAESIDFVRGDAEYNNIRIETAFSPELRLVEFDGGKLKQILLNLYLNAFDAMEQGGTMTVSSRLVTGGNEWSVVIEDTGTGIEAEVLQVLFDPYFTTKKTGTGLGLSIVHNLVQGLGGNITVTSEVGRGTSFTLVFPTNAARIPSERTSERHLNSATREANGESVEWADRRNSETS